MLDDDLFRSIARAFRAAALGRVFGNRAIRLANMNKRIARIIQPIHHAPNHLEIKILFEFLLLSNENTIPYMVPYIILYMVPHIVSHMIRYIQISYLTAYINLYSPIYNSIYESIYGPMYNSIYDSIYIFTNDMIKYLGSCVVIVGVKVGLM